MRARATDLSRASIIRMRRLDKSLASPMRARGSSCGNTGKSEKTRRPLRKTERSVNRSTSGRNGTGAFPRESTETTWGRGDPKHNRECGKGETDRVAENYGLAHGRTASP